jgi:CheY-like chemotaxis protein
MGGSMGMDSQVGQGSTFWLTLQLQRDTQAGPDAVPHADLSGMRVLMANSHEATLRVLREYMASWGIRTETSLPSHNEVLSALRTAAAEGNPYHAVIAGVLLSGEKGTTLAAAVKADPALRATAVALVSPLRQVKQVIGVPGDELDAVLLKPVRQSQLLETLTAIRQHSMAMQTQSGSTRSSQTKSGKGLSRPGSVYAQRFADARLRVLVAEDNIVNQKVAVSMLERLGVRADVAGNGREAVAMCAMLPYDVVFMDCQMPEMDGWEAAAEIRKHEGAARRASIIAMTAEALGRDRCINAGMDDFLPKPVRFEDLAEVLQRWASPAGVGRV